MNRIAKWFIVSALIVSIGLHWALLQSVAWVGMMVSYSQDCSVKEAIAKTFDGKHPCKLCKLVHEGQKSETKDDAKIDLKKEDSAGCKVTEFIFPTAPQQTTSFFMLAPERTDNPALPPPRTNHA